MRPMGIIALILAKVFTRLDVNSDGKLTPDEFAAFSPPRTYSFPEGFLSL